MAATLTIHLSIKNQWLRHKTAWQSCLDCKLCSNRLKVVFCRGKLPAPCLFIGEAPGETENILGYPFRGLAGNLLDEMLDNIQADYGDFRYAMTNTVGCLPMEDSILREPKKEEMKACYPRLLELTKLCNPKLIVFLGRIAAKQRALLSKDYTYQRVCSVIELIHPAAILRQPSAQADVSRKRFILSLTEALVETGIV